ATGPIVNFAHTALTGRNAIGMNVARTPPPSGSNVIEHLRAAAIQANPVSATLLGEDKKKQDMSFGERALELLGPYNPYKQRGDQTLAEMHGRLRELTDARRVFHNEPGNIGKAFPDEAEYHVLQRFSHHIQRLEDVINGRVHTPRGTIQLPPERRL